MCMVCACVCVHVGEHAGEHVGWRSLNSGTHTYSVKLLGVDVQSSVSVYHELTFAMRYCPSASRGNRIDVM